MNIPLDLEIFFLNNDENTPQIEINLIGPTLEFQIDKIITIVRGALSFLNDEKLIVMNQFY